MLKINFMSSLFVGIDVSSRSKEVIAMDFHYTKFLSKSFDNNRPGAELLAERLGSIFSENTQFDTLVIALESTSVYSIHIANFLSTYETLLKFRPLVYCLNPKTTANYRKSYIGMSKTDLTDSYINADFARSNRISISPWRGPQHLVMQRLTRHRLHLVECMAIEKTYMISNLYLKFSELKLVDGVDAPFSNIYGATSSSILTEFISPEDIINADEEDLLEFIAAKSKNRISDLSRTAQLLKKAARDSYRLDECLYKPLTISLASSFNCITVWMFS